jgi:hypothetical protein
LILGEQAALEFAHAIQIAALAATEDELNEAADHLARAFVTAGVAVLVGVLAKLGGDGKAGGAPKEEGAGSGPQGAAPNADPKLSCGDKT